MKKILVVDDVEINRDLLTEILEDEYEVIEAENGKEALEKIHACEDELAAVLLDLMMPVMDGFETLEVLRAEQFMDRVPVLVISGESSVSSESRCLEYGVADFVHKPFNEKLVESRISNITSLYAYKNGLEDKVAEQTETLRQQNHALQEQAERLERFNNTIVDILGTVVESRNLESGDHVQRVKGYTRILAERLMTDFPEFGLTPGVVNMMVQASSLHDVGKIAISDAILLKPGRLTPEEFDEMKKHTTRGSELLNSIQGAWDEDYRKLSYDICRHHHERYDGRGYPDGLVGDRIPLAAQIVSIADVYDALVSKRCYKDAYSRDEAYRMILDGECGVFSPKILTAFRNVKREFEELSAAAVS